MDPAVARALDRLRDPSGDELRALARLVVDEATATPLRDLAKPRWIAGQIATSLEAVARGDVAGEWVDRKIAEGRDAWRAESRPLRTWMPKEAEEPLRKVLIRQWTPDKDLTLRIIDQPAMRKLVAIVLEDALLSFQKRVKSLDKTGLGGIGVRAARKGRGIFGDMARSLGEELGDVAKGLGGLTENLVGAVTEEVEHAFQARIREFVAQATGDALKNVANHLADPRFSEGFGDLRIAVLDVILDTPISKLTAEADKLKPEELIDVVIGAIRSSLDQPDFVDQTEARVAKALDQAGDGTLGAWLDEVGLRAVWSDTTVELVTARLQAVVKSEKFAGWWTGLFAE
jgi:hypothetical protein